MEGIELSGDTLEVGENLCGPAHEHHYVTNSTVITITYNTLWICRNIIQLIYESVVVLHNRSTDLSSYFTHYIEIHLIMRFAKLRYREIG